MLQIEYIAADYSTYEDPRRDESYDFAYMEGGILHYFGDAADMFRKTHRMLRRDGRLILDDFHPYRKLASDFPTGGDYFDKEIAHLLVRPTEWPSQKPIVSYHDFVYQAQSWNVPRRVVAKVEWHQGELFPRVGFIVTKPELSNEGNSQLLQWQRHSRAVD